MEELDIQNKITDGIAAALKAIEDKKAAEKELADKLEAARLDGEKKAVEEMRTKGLLRASEYHSIDKKNDSDDGMGAFKSWLSTGQTNHELIVPDSSYLNIKTSGVFNVTTGAEGGYLVPDPLLNRIIAKRDLASWVRQAPCQIFQTEADHLVVPIEDTRHADFTSTAESAAYSNDTTGNVAQVDLTLTKYTKVVKVTEEFLSAKNSNWESWMTGVLARAEAGTENALATAVVLNDATAGSAFASATAITVAELARCVGELSNGYAVTGEAGFLMKNGSKWYIKGLYTATQRGDEFFGFPAYVSDDMQAMTAGLKSVVFGNWNYFGVIEKPGMMVQRNPYLYMANGQVGIFASIFRGYDTLQTEAIRSYAQA